MKPGIGTLFWIWLWMWIKFESWRSLNFPYWRILNLVSTNSDTLTVLWSYVKAQAWMCEWIGRCFPFKSAHVRFSYIPLRMPSDQVRLRSYACILTHLELRCKHWEGFSERINERLKKNVPCLCCVSPHREGSRYGPMKGSGQDAPCWGPCCPGLYGA